MNIGIIGTGNMGKALGLAWARSGHSVLFGSRDLAKAQAVAARSKEPARAGDFDAAAEFGEVVLYTVRGVFPSNTLTRPRSLFGKIVVDCNNRDLGDDSRPAEFDLDRPGPATTLSDELQRDVPAARVVKAFSTIPHPVIELGREKLAPYRVSAFLCSNDASAKAVVKGLAADLGLAAVDSGGLERARLVDGLADFLRFQIGPMGLGLFATLSIDVVAPPTGASS
jgi:predicted dinucleotide-binding enzyme